MAQSLMLRLLLGALFCIPLCSCRATPQEHAKETPQCSSGRSVQASGLAAVWSDFRTAALAGDMQQVSTMVRFPLLSSGVLDSDPTKKIQRNSFATFFQGFLAAPSGESPDNASVKQLISSQACLQDKVLNDAGDSAQIGNMVFTRVGGAWRLTQVFSASD